MTTTPLQENILRIIGQTGIARMKELKEDALFQELSYSELYQAVKELEELHVVKRTLFSFAGSTKHHFYAFELTEKGRKEAETLLKYPPILSQKQTLLKKHGDLEVAYLFKDCQTHLKEKAMHVAQTENGYAITIANETYPLFIDTRPKGEKKYTREEYMQKFDEMYAQSSTFYYLSSGFVSSRFLILDEVEAWLKTKFTNEEALKTFRFYSSHMGRIFNHQGEQWDSLIDL